MPRWTKKKGTRKLAVHRTPRLKNNSGVIVKLQYADAYSLVTVPFYAVALRGNGMYDPDITSAGLQPRGFDQYMALYKNFRVIRSRVTAWLAAGTSTPAGGNIALNIRADAASGITVSDIVTSIAQPNSAWKCGGAAGGNPVRISNSKSTKQVLGMSYKDSELTGDASADPAVQWHWHLEAGTMDETTAINAELFFVIEYTVLFTGRKTLALS